VTSSSTADSAAVAGQVQLLSDLLDAQVLLQDGDAVGDITDLVLGPRGNILYAVATYEGRKYLIPYRGMSFNPADQTVQLSLTADQFQDVHFFEGRNLPNLSAPAVRRQILMLFSGGQARGAAEPRVQESESPAATKGAPNGEKSSTDSARDDKQSSVRDTDTASEDNRDRERGERTSKGPTAVVRPPILSPRTTQPSTTGGVRTDRPNGVQPNPNPRDDRRTPGGPPIVPPPGVKNPGGKPIAPPAGVTNPGGKPIAPPAGVTNPGGAPVAPPAGVTNPGTANPGNAPRSNGTGGTPANGGATNR
jgi:hypothetical protein